jgi:hypothetical protein
VISHEYREILHGPPNEVFFKVSDGAGSLATAHTANGQPDSTDRAADLEAVEASEAEITIKLDELRRAALVRVFPEFGEMPDEEIETILRRIPSIVEQGRKRFSGKQKVEQRMRVFFAWLEGKSQREVAEVEGLAQSAAVSLKVSHFLTSLRDNFSWDEIISGELVEIEEESSKPPPGEGKQSPPKPKSVLGRSPESINYWRGVAKELKATTDRKVIVGDAFKDNS